ncbi:MAG TPA: hypothetical protein VK741_04215 [Acetobacteraceae bacterium]|nr:hypothetical protein [Acetobacteraceae bacterium]
MPASASVTVQSLRSAQRELSHGPVMPRLWHALCGEWQRMADRAAARSVRKLDHAGVTEDYRTACRHTYH